MRNKKNIIDIHPYLEALFLFADCGTEYSIANGYVDFTKGLTTYSHTASVTCHESYDIRGSREVRCLENGTWSHTFCQIKGTI